MSTACGMEQNPHYHIWWPLGFHLPRDLHHPFMVPGEYERLPRGYQNSKSAKRLAKKRAKKHANLISVDVFVADCNDGEMGRRYTRVKPDEDRELGWPGPSEAPPSNKRCCRGPTYRAPEDCEPASCVYLR